MLQNATQAIDLIKIATPQLKESMHVLGISSDTIFQDWTREECEYLRTVGVEMEEDVLKLEYFSVLKKLSDAWYVSIDFSQ